MKIEGLSESDLLSFSHDYNKLYIEFNILVNDNKKLKIFAHNKDSKPISVEYIGLDIKSNFTTINNTPSLGEIESAEETDNGFCLEGDFGYIKVIADTYAIE